MAGRLARSFRRAWSGSFSMKALIVFSAEKAPL